MSNWPVACAAIAAFFSAIAAISAYRLQKKVAFQSFAPLISLYGWQMGRLGCIEIKKIKNYGQGPALRMHAFEISQKYPLYYPRAERNTVQAVSPQEERDIAWQLFLSNASSSPTEAVKIQREELQHMNFQIVLSYLDINNRRHYTIFDLLYIRGGCISVCEKLTPELILQRQKTIVRYDWFVRLMGNLHLTIAKVKSKVSGLLAFFCGEDKNNKAG